ncbi:MAG: DUF4380 domain-containing protein [Deltaproteobacteria bacterium]|nr:DUF4380 domain-containing protein [Deltaproteobacteria bacterium]
MSTEASFPTVNGSVYTFTFGDTTFAVDAAKAGRIAVFALAGQNILCAAKNSEDNNWGSTFWPSPQSDWNWPPPAEIDPGPYRAEMQGASLLVESPPAPGLGLAVSKRFSVDAAKAVVTIEYGIANQGKAPRKVAPWEISRVASGGLTFFPMGEGRPWKGPQELLSLRLQDGVAWLASETRAASTDQKVFADGREGWIAHVAGDLILVKAFADTTPPQAAPGEAEIELYTDPGRTYVEVENQGAYMSLQPGAALAWPVRWFLRKLDTSVPRQAGSVALLALVRGLVP